MIHGYEIAPTLIQQSVGKELCIVGTPVCFDHMNNRHCLATVPNGERFCYDGVLVPNKDSYTFIRVFLKEKTPIPVIASGEQTEIISHDTCSWQGARTILELCSGLGALGQGAVAAGFKVMAACDFRPKMCRLYTKHSEAAVVTGDICKLETLLELAKVFPVSGVIAAGISCQPYSWLGDCRGGQDPRSSTLPSTLSIAYYLRAMVIVLECVGPAQTDPFVNHHINNFCSKTRFIRSDCLLELHELWPSRRSRWWCILSAPAIGKIEVGSCKDFLDLPTVEHVLPRIRKWPQAEEEELRLTPVELEAFRESDRQRGSHLLNKKGPMPCALHCWGSQLTACPCGCRDQGLSSSRLKSKGLCGVLVESTVLGAVRHLHPQEAAALCGLDPTLHWGCEARLALGAVGQLASPVQSLWVFAHVLKRLQTVQWQVSTVDPKLMMMAYRAWLLVKCKVLLYDYTHFPASEALANSARFESLRAVPIQKLLSLHAGQDRDTTIQVVWENIGKMTHRITTLVTPPSTSEDGASEAELPPTTMQSSGEEELLSLSGHGLSVSQVAIDDNDFLDISAESSFHIVMTHQDGPPIEFRVSGHPTVSQLQQAEVQLHGVKRKACQITEDGEPVQDGCQFLQPGLIYGSKIDDSDLVSPHEVVEAEVPPLSAIEISVVPGSTFAEEVSHLDGLKGNSFLGLHPPVVHDFAQAESLLNQRSDVATRLKVLDSQCEVWADDELRWHLSRLQFAAEKEHQVVPIDPILMHGAFKSMKFTAIESFLQTVQCKHSCYISVVHQHQHWYPIVLQCTSLGLQVVTWDHPNADHRGLREFSQWFAAQVGMSLAAVQQIERRFSGEAYCGALSIGFLEHRLFKFVLPETASMAEEAHRYLRRLFRDAVAGATTTWQPWIWGAGVGEASVEQVVDALTPVLVAHGVSSDHAHHRSKQAVKAIGHNQVMQALQGKAPWRSLKQLGSNVKFRFITEEELQMQITARAGKEAIGKPSRKTKSSQDLKQVSEVALDPTKLCLPDGAFTGGGKVMQQLPLSMLGPMSEGVVVVTWSQAEPYLKSSQIIAKGPLALVVLQGPNGGCPTSLHVSMITVPARCLANQEPILLEAALVQIGSIQVSKAVASSPVSIESVQVATVKLTVFRDECAIEWEQFCGAPLKYVLQQCPLLKYCRVNGCTCPCWRNAEELNVSDAIVDVWRRQFLRAGYKPEPPKTSSIFSVCIRIPACLLSRILTNSGEGGIYAEPRSMDSKEVHRDYEVVWIPKSDKAALSHLRQTNPAAIGIVRIGDRYGLRVKAAQAADLHRAVRPEAVYLATGVRQQYLVGPIPYGTDRKALCKALLQMPWEVKPLQPIAALEGQRGVMWTVVAVSEPPTNIIHMSHGEVLITKQKESPVQRETSMKPVATPATISLCGTGQID